MAIASYKAVMPPHFQYIIIEFHNTYNFNISSRSNSLRTHTLNMKLILTGTTGFIGHEVLTQALSHPSLTSITTLTRHPLPPPLSTHPKLHSLLINDFSTYPPSILTQLSGADACIWYPTPPPPHPPPFSHHKKVHRRKIHLPRNLPHSNTRLRSRSHPSLLATPKKRRREEEVPICVYERDPCCARGEADLLPVREGGEEDCCISPLFPLSKS
jgi:hypothetical protein